MYQKLHLMVGNVDFEKCDFEKGLLVTDTGYTSKWWTDEDIDSFRQLGHLVREDKTEEYIFLELGF